MYVCMYVCMYDTFARLANCSKSSNKRLQQMDQFNWICPACFLTALPFAVVSILSREGEQEPAVDHTDIYKSLKDSLGNKNLKVGHINVNGIINKLK